MGGKEILEAINMAATIQEFNVTYYNSGETTWKDTRWRGVNVAKCPTDLWQYQEIIYETKPDVIIETGTWRGGSALFLRDMLKLMGKSEAKVITIDICPAGIFREENGVVQLIGDSIGDTITGFVKHYINAEDKVMVILDSNHAYTHVKKELEIYSQFVTPGMYLIVEDTNVNGNPVLREHGPGPMEALEEWLKRNTGFQVDEYRERFMLTFNPKGYCRRYA